MGGDVDFQGKKSLREAWPSVQPRVECRQRTSATVARDWKKTTQILVDTALMLAFGPVVHSMTLPIYRPQSTKENILVSSEQRSIWF